MKLACIVLAHHRPSQLALLLARLSHPQVRIYLQIDRRARIGPFNTELAARDLGEITLLPRHQSRWGGLGLLDAEIDGLRRGLADRCDYFLLLSGQDFPLWPIERVLAFFEAVGERSYIDHFPLPDQRWAYDGRMRTDFYSYDLLGRRETCIPRGEEHGLNWKGRLLNGLLRLWTAHKPPRRFPSYLSPFGGSQWWNLSREAVEFVIAFLESHPDYRQYHAHTLAPDEIFFQSVLLGTSFSETHEVVNDSLRFMIWPEASSHPRTLGLGDLPAMLASGKPFARKFDDQVDQSVLMRLADDDPSLRAARPGDVG